METKLQLQGKMNYQFCFKSFDLCFQGVGLLRELNFEPGVFEEESSVLFLRHFQELREVTTWKNKLFLQWNFQDDKRVPTYKERNHEAERNHLKYCSH